MIGTLSILASLAAGFAAGRLMAHRQAPGGSRLQAPSNDNTPRSDRGAATLSPKARGDRFEAFVVRAIHAGGVLDDSAPVRRWLFTEWRGDKYLDDLEVGPESSRKPDLEFSAADGSLAVAIECKWRSQWSLTQAGKEKIDWARPDQLACYQEHERTGGLPVCIAIGVGWDEQRQTPVDLFTVPVSQIRYTSLTKAFIEPWRARPEDLGTLLDRVHADVHPRDHRPRARKMDAQIPG